MLWPSDTNLSPLIRPLLMAPPTPQKPEVKSNDDHSGSTAITCLITPTHFFIANCGDSRSIGISNGIAIPFSDDHKPYNPKEESRIREAGGSVQMKRVNGDLAVSRALGDFVYKNSPTLPPEKQQVSCEPDIIVYERKHAEDQFIVLACDGIWDVMSNEECAAYIMGVSQVTQRPPPRNLA